MPLVLSGSTGIAGVDGSASTPAVQGTDTNTGIAFPAADTVAIGTGGTERMRVDSSGNVGIGTSSPLNIANYRNVALQGGSVGCSYSLFNSSGVEGGRLQLDANQVILLNATAALPTTFATNSIERARITSGGEFLVGTTNTDPIGAQTSGVVFRPTGIGDFNANNNECLKVGRFGGTGTLVQIFYHNGSTLSVVGSISTNGSSTSYNTTSDYRLKENVTPLTDAAARVQTLKPSRFNFISDPNCTVDGFIAHEAAEVVPQAVTGEKDAVNEDGSIKPQGIDHSKLVPLLTAALQEALTKIAALEARLTALEAK